MEKMVCVSKPKDIYALKIIIERIYTGDMMIEIIQGN
jgi:hypothetical protein